MQNTTRERARSSLAVVVLISGVGEKAPVIAMELESGNGGFGFWTVIVVAVGGGELGGR